MSVCNVRVHRSDEWHSRLLSRQFIGANSAISDQYKGKVVVWLNMFECNFKIFGLFMNSVIYTPAQIWSPPSNISNLPLLMKPYYIKINHLACVASLTAACPIAAT
jgi:hypothetical protein